MIEVNMNQSSGVQTIGHLTQWDFGQSIKITGLDITSDTEVRFANERQGTAIKMLGKYIQEDKSLVVEIPDVSLSLFAKVLIPDASVIPEWEQPDSTNPYMTGDKVTHNNKTYVSDVDNNVWEPGVYGWTEVE